MAEMIVALPDNVHRLTQQACYCKLVIAGAGCCQLNGTSAFGTLMCSVNTAGAGQTDRYSRI